MYNLLDLFSGIGGFSLGLERSGGFKTVAFCEIEPFPRAVLAKHWPEVPCYEDVRTLTAERLAADGIAVDAICGGFPCQDISVAGNQAGIGEGTRSGLWSEIARLVGELRPRVVIVENVANLLSGPSGRPGGWFGAVLGDLAALGYDAEWHCIPASAVGAPHRRDRIWIVANAQGISRRAGFCGAGSGEIIEPCGCGNDMSHTPQLQRNGRKLHGEHSEGEVPELGNGRSAAHVADAGRIGQPRQGQSIAPLSAAPLINREAVGAFSGSASDFWSVEPDVGRVANGVPNRTHRLAALGNAVVPQIPELIGRAIMARDELDD